MNSRFELEAFEKAALSLFPREKIHPSAAAALDGSAKAEQKWLIAFSGGADSLALLVALWRNWPSQRTRMIVAHFNHSLRGEESETDAAFCAEVSGQLGLTFRQDHWRDPPALPSEEQARRVRFEFLSRAADDVGASLLLLGHQRNDVAETHFMRLARGTSSAGLSSPRPVRDWHGRRLIRPLLNLSADEIRQGLRQVEVSWREDGSNAGEQYLRNRLRLSVVPAWLQAAGPSALAGAALTRERMEEDDRALEGWLDELGIEQQVNEIDLRPLAARPVALRRRALRRWIHSATLSRTGFEELLQLSEQFEGQMSVGRGFARVREGRLSWVVKEPVQAPWKGVSFITGGKVFFPDGAWLSARETKIDEALRARLVSKNVNTANEAFVLCSGFLSARSWLPGDRYAPLGSGTAKLQDLFVNRKIPANRRALLPVICDASGGILWIPGLPPSEQCKVSADSEMAVQLTYHAGTSTLG